MLIRFSLELELSIEMSGTIRLASLEKVWQAWIFQSNHQFYSPLLFMCRSTYIVTARRTTKLFLQFLPVMKPFHFLFVSGLVYFSPNSTWSSSIWQSLGRAISPMFLLCAIPHMPEQPENAVPTNIPEVGNQHGRLFYTIAPCKKDHKNGQHLPIIQSANCFSLCLLK